MKQISSWTHLHHQSQPLVLSRPVLLQRATKDALSRYSWVREKCTGASPSIKCQVLFVLHFEMSSGLPAVNIQMTGRGWPLHTCVRPRWPCEASDITLRGQPVVNVWIPIWHWPDLLVVSETLGTLPAIKHLWQLKSLGNLDDEISQK